MIVAGRRKFNKILHREANLCKLRIYYNVSLQIIGKNPRKFQNIMQKKEMQLRTGLFSKETSYR